MTPARVVVTGGRDFNDRDAVWSALDRRHARGGIVALAHGCCSSGTVTYNGDDARLCGADGLAHGWARARGIEVEGYPADWSNGGSGGPRRNRAMLDGFRPTGVIAFPGGRGTADCCRAADERGIPVWRPLDGR